MRPSLCVRHGGRTVLVDTSTDLRQQCLRFGVRRVDAVLYTHAHADHIYGLDDLRPFNFRQQASIPCYGSQATLKRLRRVFDYVFDGEESEGGGKPRLDTVTVESTTAVDGTWKFEVMGVDVQAIPVWHGSLEVMAYRVGDFAYVTDCSDIPDSSCAALSGLRWLILDGLRYRPHPTHFSVSEAVAMAARLGAEHTYLTHMNHDIDYTAPQVDLPAGVELAYDGLSFDICF